MIHWAWLIVAVFVGGFLGILVMALCSASGRAELEEEIIRLREKVK